MSSQVEQLMDYVDQLTKALNEGEKMYADLVQRFATNINSTYDTLGSCIHAHEHGLDDLAWQTVRRLMSTLKTLELELQVVLAELKGG